MERYIYFKRLINYLIMHQILHVSLYLVIVYFATDQPLDPARFFMYLGAGIVISLVAQSTGLIVGLVFNDIEVYCIITEK